MKILVTGACGFIGSNFVRYILEKYPTYNVLNLDKLTYAGNPNNLKDIQDDSRYEFVKGDICNAELIEELISDNVDFVVNFAAESHVDRAIKDASSFVQTNVYGTYVLLEASRKYEIKKYLQISTDEVYGSIEKGSFKENDLLQPNNPYSASKAAADMMVRSYNRTYGLFTLITRSSNNFGPFQYPEKLIPSFIIHLLKKEKMPLYGNGLNVRDWLYVFDNCEAIDLVLHKGKSGEIYNIGAKNEKTNLEIAKFILHEMGESENFITFVEDRLGHDKRYSLDNFKIKKLGWAPKTEFYSVLKETITWYMENEWWWKPLIKGQL
jgi:dTDP-glucose 4,6-dehydratase